MVQDVAGYEISNGQIGNITGSVVTCSAPVNRTITPHEAYEQFGPPLDFSDAVAASMPVYGEDYVEMLFINLGRIVTTDELDLELEKMGFELIKDPIGLAAVNWNNPEFISKYHNGTQWQDVAGEYYYTTFHVFGPYVGACKDDFRPDNPNAWGAHWWFPVRHK